MNIPIDKFESWLRSKNLKERSIENYLYYFNKFVYLGFNQETVSKFLSEKSNLNTNARSMLVNLQKFIKWNYRELGFSKELREEAIEVDIPKLTGRTKKRVIRPLSQEQIHILEKYLDTETLKLQLLLSYYCGLRLGELLKISINSFNWEEWKKDKNKYGECIVFGKGDKEAPAFVPPFLMLRVANFIKSNNFSSVNSRLFIKYVPEGKTISIKDRSRTWQKKLRKAGIDSGITKLDEYGKVVEGTQVHPHKLRHSYGKLMLIDKKLGLREVQELMRHSSIRSTQIYTEISKEHLQDKLKTLS